MEDKRIGQISEIFTSAQGEGPYLGTKQIFVRFYGCNRACRFCDSRQTFFSQYSCSQVLGKISLEPKCRFLSITGGEPLLQAQFLEELLPQLKRNNFRIYLETNGTLVNQLISLIDSIEIIAMDFKLPSSTEEKDCFSEHELFLKIARKKEVFVKAVITDSTTFGDVKTAVEIISKIDKTILFILQPDTNQLSQNLFNRMSDFRHFCLEHIDNVRIMPQMHRLVGLR